MTTQDPHTPRTSRRIPAWRGRGSYANLTPHIAQARADRLTVRISEIGTNLSVGEPREFVGSFNSSSFLKRNGNKTLLTRKKMRIDGREVPVLPSITMRFIEENSTIKAQLDITFNLTKFIACHGTDLEHLRSLPSRELMFDTVSGTVNRGARGLDGNNNLLTATLYQSSAEQKEELYAFYWHAVLEAFFQEIQSRWQTLTSFFHTLPPHFLKIELTGNIL